MTQLSLFNADTNEMSQDVWQTTTHFATLDELLKYGLRDSNCYSFVNWHCTYQSLPRRAKSLLAKAKFLMSQGIISGDSRIKFCNFNGDHLYDGLYIGHGHGDGTGLDGSKGVLVPASGHYPHGMCGFTWWHKANVSDELKSTIFERYPDLRFASWSVAKKAIKEDSQLREFLKAILN